VVTGYWFLGASKDWQPDGTMVDFLKDGPPPVYVGFGSMSMFSGADQIGIVMEALKLAGQRGVLADDRAGSTIASKDILYVKNVPHDWLFPRMAAVVHHGGAGTTGASLRAGKPTVICPFVGDQRFWGQRVAALGVGPSPIPQRKLTAASLANAIQRAVSDEGMRQRTAALGEILRAENGIGRAVALINRGIKDHRTLKRA
jgi:sterol 3beta-glucosyltransferase